MIASTPWGDVALAPHRSTPLDILRRWLRARTDGDQWDVQSREWWCNVRPRGTDLPAQGWKLHLAATIGSAPAVLDASLDVLLDARAAFKFATSLRIVGVLNHGHFPREHSGKFLTVYPRSVEEAQLLAARLDRATGHLTGPRILSDVRLRPDSLVHARYGGFAGHSTVSAEGWLTSVLVSPAGEVAEDVRKPYSTVPAWVDSRPFAQAPPRPAGSQRLGGRFVVRAALRHANKGGVYRALDTESSVEVILKEARRYVHVDALDRDATDRLAHEHAVLCRLDGLAEMPRALALFWAGDHLYLAREFVPGPSLEAWVRQEPAPAHRDRLAAALVAMLRRLHSTGWIVRDLSPRNVVVTPRGPALIDVELAWPAGSRRRAFAGGTRPYAAPEQLRGARAAVPADVYSLGALLCYLYTGIDPVWLEGGAGDQLRRWLDRFSFPANVRRVIEGCMVRDPGGRLPLGDAERLLAASGTGGGRRRPSRPPAALLGDHVQAVVQLVDRSAAWSRGDRLWPVGWAVRWTDPCCFQHGAAGVVAMLARCGTVVGVRRIERTVAKAVAWIGAALEGRTQMNSGLYMGVPGIAVALHEASRLLGERRLAAKARLLLLAVPPDGVHVDAMFGTAGLGIACLHAAQSGGDDGALLEHARACARRLERDAIRRDETVTWAGSGGREWFGFAHGTAGIGTFLLACGRATAEPGWVELAAGAGRALAAAAIAHRGCAYWARGPWTHGRWAHWCHGSSGVGTFLTRLHLAGLPGAWLELAIAAATAVVRERGRAGTCQCHGLAGDGEYLLDLWEATSDARYRREAELHAAAIIARSAEVGGLLVHPDDSANGVSTSYGTGSAGIASYFVRLLMRDRRLLI